MLRPTGHCAPSSQALGDLMGEISGDGQDLGLEVGWEREQQGQRLGDLPGKAGGATVHCGVWLWWEPVNSEWEITGTEHFRDTKYPVC